MLNPAAMPSSLPAQATALLAHVDAWSRVHLRWHDQLLRRLTRAVDAHVVTLRQLPPVRASALPRHAAPRSASPHCDEGARCRAAPGGLGSARAVSVASACRPRAALRG